MTAKPSYEELEKRLADAENALSASHNDTDNLAHEKNIRNTHARLFTVIEQSPESIVITDTEGIIEYVNPTFEHITGYSRDEAIGKSPCVLKSGAHSDEFYKQMWAIITSGNVWKGRFTNKRKDGSLYHEEAIISPILDEHNAITGYVALKTDITRQLEWEQSLQNMQKLQAVGTLACGIAHDFNNILTSILGSITYLKNYELEQNHPVQETLQIMLNATYRARDLVEQIVSFSRTGGSQLKPINAIPIIEEVLKMLKNTLPNNVHLQFHTVNKDAWFMGIETKLYQVLMNLCTNSIQSMNTNGGILDIAIDEVSREAIEIPSVNTEPLADRYWLLTIKDSGIGIPISIQDRIFEPFFTTKQTSGGSGLGLAVVFGIVKNFNGFIRLESPCNSGTTFFIYLPQTEKPTLQDTSPTPLNIATDKKRLLIVDDNEHLLPVWKKGLSRLGYQVSVFPSSLEALSTFSHNPHFFDIAVIDYAMPYLRGDRLATELLRVNSQLPIFILTGLKEITLDSFLKKSGVKCLYKPMTPEELAEIIQTHKI